MIYNTTQTSILIRRYYMALLNIKETVQQVADAITASIELETEIVDQDLMIVGGTGRYKKKIGTF